MAVKIVSPSFKRAGRVKALDYFKGSKVVVCESQRDEYHKHYRGRVIAIPDEEDGNIAKARNWILRNIPRPHIMVDDDVERIGHSEGGKQQIPLSWQQAERVIAQGFNLAQEWGCVVWGVNVNEDGRNYQEYKPFSLTQVVLGPFTAHLKHDLMYDERIPLKDDYDFALQVMRKHKKMLRMNKYHYICEHGKAPGGCVSYRTVNAELKQRKLMMKKWGRDVVYYPMNPKKSAEVLNGRVRVPLKGV